MKILRAVRTADRHLPGNQDPTPGCPVGGADAVEEPGSVANTDLCPDTASHELEKEGMQPAGVFVAQLCDVTVPFRQQT
jgi:hypothetical protein